MRWQQLFDDLDAELAAEQSRARDGEVADRIRYEFGLVSLRDRLGGAIGRTLHLQVGCGCLIEGILRSVGSDWILMHESPLHNETLVSTDSLIFAAGIGPNSTPGLPWDGPDPLAGERLRLRHMVRGLSRDRAVVELHTTDGLRHCGTVDRVGSDYGELAVHPLELPRRMKSVSEVRLVPLRVITMVRVITP